VTAVALRLVGVRRRRLRPPGPGFWWALVMVLAHLAGIAVAAGCLLARDLPRVDGRWIGLDLWAITQFAVILAWIWWPVFRAELRAWLDGDR
jgi:hypothetical protein